MLVLSRYKNESIVINHEIIVTVSEIHIHKVCLSIVLPKGVPISPQEVSESIRINDNITIAIQEIRGDKVYLSIVAPKEIPIHRQENSEGIHSESLPRKADPARKARLK